MLLKSTKWFLLLAMKLASTRAEIFLVSLLFFRNRFYDPLPRCFSLIMNNPLPNDCQFARTRSASTVEQVTISVLARTAYRIHVWWNSKKTIFSSLGKTLNKCSPWNIHMIILHFSSVIKDNIAWCFLQQGFSSWNRLKTSRKKCLFRYCILPKKCAVYTRLCTHSTKIYSF